MLFRSLLAASPRAAAPPLLSSQVAFRSLVEKKEKEILAQIAKGTLDRSWVDKILRAKGALK